MSLSHVFSMRLIHAAQVLCEFKGRALLGFYNMVEACLNLLQLLYFSGLCLVDQKQSSLYMISFCGLCACFYLWIAEAYFDFCRLGLVLPVELKTAYCINRRFCSMLYILFIVASF